MVQIIRSIRRAFSNFRVLIAMLALMGGSTMLAACGDGVTGLEPVDSPNTTWLMRVTSDAPAPTNTYGTPQVWGQGMVAFLRGGDLTALNRSNGTNVPSARSQVHPSRSTVT